MIEAFTPAEVAEKYLGKFDLDDPERWLRRRLADGRIKGKWLSRKRGLVLMTEKHIELWLDGDEMPAVPVVAADEGTVVSGVSGRAAARRLRRAS